MIDSISENGGAAPDLKRARRIRRLVSNGSLDRLPPHDIDAERSVIGCCMVSPNDCLNQVMIATRGEKEAFYDPRHQTIFEAFTCLSSKGTPIDLISVQGHLKTAGLLDQIGGIPYLTECEDIHSPANLSYWLETVLEKYLLRKMIQTCTDAVGRIYDWQGDVNELLDSVERDILSIQTVRGSKGQPTVRELVHDAIAQIETKFNAQGAITGLPTGFPDLDGYTDGLHPGEMTVIAAFPSVGKTALAMNIAEHVVLKSKIPVGVFSLEMASVQLVKRCLCSVGRCNLRKVSNGQLTDYDGPRLTSAAGQLSNAKIYFDDQSDMSIYELRAKARRMWQQYGIKLFVVDYIQLLNARGGSHKHGNRQEEVAAISNGLKNMAKELRVPVIALSQLNDDGQLRESRAIGQDADGLWKLDEKNGVHELWIRKQRNGPRNVCVNLKFLADFTRFESASKISDEDAPTH